MEAQPSTITLTATETKDLFTSSFLGKLTVTADDFSPSHTLVANVEDGTVRFSDGTTMTGANHFSVSYTAIFKFTNTGLHQSLNGSTFYRGTPLVYAVLFVWSGGQYSASQWMNPLNLGMRASRISQGKIKVTHNFGKASYFPVVQALEGTYYLFAQVAAVDNNSVTIWRIDRDGHMYDGAFYLFLYDISTFNN